MEIIARDLIVYCPWLAPVGKDLFVKRIHRDENAIEALEAKLVRFMRLVDGYLQILRAPARMSGARKDQPAPPPIEPPPWGDALKPDPKIASLTKRAVSNVLPENIF